MLSAIYTCQRYITDSYVKCPIHLSPVYYITGSSVKRPIHSHKMSDFSVWRHTWWKNWVNCAVLTDNSADLRTVLSNRLSHRELCSSLTESHSFPSLPAHTTMASFQGTQQNLQKTDKPDRKPVLCQRIFSSVFVQIFYTVIQQILTYSVWGPLALTR
jgi:hypothetical protein